MAEVAQDIAESPVTREPWPTGGKDYRVARCEERTETSLVGVIRLNDGTAIPCMVKNLSPRGARLGISQTCRLPETFMFKINGRNFVCLVRLAWRQGNYAGVRIERVSKLPEPNRPAHPAS